MEIVSNTLTGSKPKTIFLKTIRFNMPLLIVFNISTAIVLVTNLTVGKLFAKAVAFLVVISFRSFSISSLVFYENKSRSLCLKISLICLIIGCSSKNFFLSFAQLFFLLSDCFEYYDTRLDFLAGKYIVEVKTSISSIPFDLVLMLLDVKISWWVRCKKRFWNISKDLVSHNPVFFDVIQVIIYAYSS